MNWTLIYIISSLLILPALIYGLVAQSSVSSTFDKYARVSTRNNVTASELTQKLLNNAGVTGVKIATIDGKLSDCYDPRYKVVKLSRATFSSTSIASIGVCAHEVGHAIQHSKGSFLFKLRSALVPVCNLISRAFIPLILIGSILSFTFYIPIVGYYICLGSLIAYGSSLIFQIVTLPLEYDASKRALKLLKDTGLFTNEEISGSKKVLTAAIHTYIASALTTLVYFLRYLSYVMIFARNRD